LINDSFHPRKAQYRIVYKRQKNGRDQTAFPLRKLEPGGARLLNFRITRALAGFSLSKNGPVTK
jgi:hypothetical protein